MTNEEKIKEIVSGEVHPIIVERCVREMANWKDWQYRGYLEKKKSEYGIDYNVNPIDMLNEIIEELFGEEVTDQTDNDE